MTQRERNLIERYSYCRLEDDAEAVLCQMGRELRDNLVDLRSLTDYSPPLVHEKPQLSPA